MRQMRAVQGPAADYQFNLAIGLLVEGFKLLPKFSGFAFCLGFCQEVMLGDLPDAIQRFVRPLVGKNPPPPQPIDSPLGQYQQNMRQLKAIFGSLLLDNQMSRRLRTSTTSVGSPQRNPMLRLKIDQRQIFHKLSCWQTNNFHPTAVERE